MKGNISGNWKFNLLDNAKDSLAHAVEHLTNEGRDPSLGDYKRVILDVSHTVELLLKERVGKIHPAFIWKKVDDYGDRDAQTIDTNQAVGRLLKLDGIILSPKALDTIKSCRRVRNSIEHYEFEIEPKEARATIGRMLSFIFTFSQTHLKIDLEADFRADDRWRSLIEIYEFFEEHSKVIEAELAEKMGCALNCPQCGAETFEASMEKCLMCGHHESLIECESCEVICFESETMTFEDGDEDSGAYSYAICNDCYRSAGEESDALESMRDWHHEE